MQQSAPRAPQPKGGDRESGPMEQALRILVAAAACAAIVHIIVPGIRVIVRG